MTILPFDMPTLLAAIEFCKETLKFPPNLAEFKMFCIEQRKMLRDKASIPANMRIERKRTEEERENAARIMAGIRAMLDKKKIPD